jgi:hypothetical protein
LHNEELNDLHSSAGTITWIKTMKFKWAWHVAHIGDRRNACGVLMGMKERGCWKEQGVDRIILQVSKCLYGVTLLTTSLLLLSVLFLNAFKASYRQ